MTKNIDFLNKVMQRVLPFVVFAFLTYCLPYTGLNNYYAYIAKTLIILLVLFFLYKSFKEEIIFRPDVLSVFSGVLVFFVWIGLEGFYPAIGSDDSFNPFSSGESKGVVYLIIFFRLFGAVVIVPLIEELFWRSFALRFLIDTDFVKVPAGTFSWFSFIAVSIAFGFEHFRWLPGIIAGAVYAFVYYRTKNLFSPILAHSVTNLMLGLYVLSTESWSFW